MNCSEACFIIAGSVFPFYSPSVPYFLADNAGPGLCLQWKEIFAMVITQFYGPAVHTRGIPPARNNTGNLHSQYQVPLPACPVLDW